MYSFMIYVITCLEQPWILTYQRPTAGTLACQATPEGFFSIYERGD